MFILHAESLLEGFIDVCLDVVLMELAFAFLVLVQVVSHVFIQTLLLLIKS